VRTFELVLPSILTVCIVLVALLHRILLGDDYVKDVHWLVPSPCHCQETAQVSLAFALVPWDSITDFTRLIQIHHLRCDGPHGAVRPRLLLRHPLPMPPDQLLLGQEQPRRDLYQRRRHHRSYVPVQRNLGHQRLHVCYSTLLPDLGLEHVRQDQGPFDSYSRDGLRVSLLVITSAYDP